MRKNLLEKISWKLFVENVFILKPVEIYLRGIYKQADEEMIHNIDKHTIDWN